MKRSIQLAGTLAAAFVLTFSACKKDENAPPPSATTDNEAISDRSNPDAVNATSLLFRTGYVYTESNAVDANAVLVYAQQRDGSLKLQSAAKTGGIGNGRIGLSSQGALAIDENHTMLYAVNAGDNTISAFRISADGNLTLQEKVNSGGTMPVSVTAYRNLLYVVNAGTASIAGFNTGADVSSTSSALRSRMIPIAGSVQKLSAAIAAPGQISFSPNGAYLYVTEKMTNHISSFQLDANGAAQPAVVNESLGKTPFGFAYGNDMTMIVANATNDVAGLGAVTALSGVNTSTLTPVGTPLYNQQTSSCWVAVTRYGRYAYVTNTASNSISVYAIGLAGRLQLLFPAIPAGLAPTDITVDASNRFVYNLSSGEHTIHQNWRDARGFITNLICDGGGVINLPPAAAGLVTFTPGIAVAVNSPK